MKIKERLLPVVCVEDHKLYIIKKMYTHLIRQKSIKKLIFGIILIMFS